MAYTLQKLHREKSNEPITFVIKGNPITKKNSSRIIKSGDRTLLIPSKQYKAYEKDFVIGCMEAKVYNRLINYPCNFKYKYYMKTKRKVDLTNLISATDDCLQSAKVITDDDCTIVVAHDGCRVYYDKDNPRTEIEIVPILDEEIFPRKDD